MRTVSPIVRFPEVRRITVKLRLHARTEDLDVTWANDFLGLSENDPAVKRMFAYRDESVVGCEFQEWQELASVDEVERST